MAPELPPDVSQRIAADPGLRAYVDDLRGRLELFEHALASTPDVIARFDRQLRFQYVSPAIETATRMPPDAFPGKTSAELGLPDGVVGPLHAALVQVLTTGAPQTLRFVFPAAHTARTYETRLIPEAGPDGTAATILAIWRDITPRHDAEVALEASEARLRLALHDSLVTVSTQDPDLRYTWIYNPQSPLTTAMVLGKTDADLLAPDDAGRLMAFKRRALESGTSIRDEIALTIGEHTALFDIRAEPIVDKHGSVAGLTCVAIDITERARAEIQRIESERKLQETQRNESIALLAGGVAHDFNNLLAIIRGNVDMALADIGANAAARARLHQIVVAANRATALTRQLLTYAGQRRFDLQPISLNDLVRDNALLLESSVAKSVQLVYEIASDLPLVLGDESQLGQLLMNLVVNATEAINPPGGTITITTAPRHVAAGNLQGFQIGSDLAPGDYVALTVADTGSGIDPAVLERIFEPFFTTKYTGRGLGLAVIHGIVQRHQGALLVQSTVGVGSTFTVLLPALATTPVAQPLVLPPTIHAGTVLVVDDEAGVRLVAGRMIERLGFATVLAADGPTALELVQTRPGEIVAILLDLTMPRMDGLEVYRDLQRIAPTVPVLLMSGYRVDDVTRQYTGLAAAGFLQKPFSFDALEKALGRIGLGRGGSGQVASA